MQAISIYKRGLGSHKAGGRERAKPSTSQGTFPAFPGISLVRSGKRERRGEKKKEKKTERKRKKNCAKNRLVLILDKEIKDYLKL